MSSPDSRSSGVYVLLRLKRRTSARAQLHRGKKGDPSLLTRELELNTVDTSKVLDLVNVNHDD